MPEALAAAFWLWIVAMLLAFLRWSALARLLMGLGAVAGIMGVLGVLPHGTPVMRLPEPPWMRPSFFTSTWISSPAMVRS